MPLSLTETEAGELIRNYVRKDLALGIYDPMQPRRPRVNVLDFEIDFLDVDGSDVHAAGTVQLEGPSGVVEQFLRVSVPVEFDGAGWIVPSTATVRAAYVFETDHPNGACRETAALANV